MPLTSEDNFAQLLEHIKQFDGLCGDWDNIEFQELAESKSAPLKDDDGDALVKMGKLDETGLIEFVKFVCLNDDDSKTVVQDESLLRSFVLEDIEDELNDEEDNPEKPQEVAMHFFGLDYQQLNKDLFEGDIVSKWNASRGQEILSHLTSKYTTDPDNEKKDENEAFFRDIADNVVSNKDPRLVGMVYLVIHLACNYWFLVKWAAVTGVKVKKLRQVCSDLTKTLNDAEESFYSLVYDMLKTARDASLKEDAPDMEEEDPSSAKSKPNGPKRAFGTMQRDCPGPSSHAPKVGSRYNFVPIEDSRPIIVPHGRMGFSVVFVDPQSVEKLLNATIVENLPIVEMEQ